MRHNGRMTERVDLTNDFPAGATSIHAAITSRARLVILREVLHSPGITATELEERLDLSLPMIRDSIRKLRELGYVLDDPQPGRQSHLIADRAKVTRDWSEMLATLIG